MAEHSAVPDYQLDDRLELGPDQLKVLLDDTRLDIIDLLTERAATTSQLADALAKPKGTVGHHCKALEAAGLIHVVRTARVRAIEERYYGRTARLFVLGDFRAAGLSMGSLLDKPMRELEAAAAVEDPDVAEHLATARYARIPAERAAEWAQRLAQLADEFAAQPRDGDTVYGILIGLFATDRKGLA